MKSLYTLIAALLFNIGFTQTNSINYKALIKDDLGNIVANQAINIRFTIYTETGLHEVYKETHTGALTDANGIVMVNIGEGFGTLKKTLSDINWGSDTHLLQVEIDIEQDASYVDLGTTPFMAVPYALHANNVSGLEYIDETNDATDNGGWRIIGRDPANYGNIGDKAIDLSYSSSASASRGAMGNYSTAIGLSATASGPFSFALGYLVNSSGDKSTSMGDNTEASGDSSTAMGRLTEASGINSTALGNNTTASGDTTTAMGFYTIASGMAATAMGYDTKAQSFVSTSIGRYNVGGGNVNSWISTDPLFEVGNGTGDLARTNAFVIRKNGNATLAGTLTQNSDKRLKTEITPLNYGLNEVLQLSPVSYYWKKDREGQTQKSIGLIAQEVQPILKELVKVGHDQAQTLSVDYISLVPILIKAIQEQQQLIENQQDTINSLTLEKESISKRFEKIEQLLSSLSN